jgi:SAM-dependent methyltransferase
MASPPPLVPTPDPTARQASAAEGDSAPFEAAWRSRFEEFATIRDDDAGIAGWSSSGLAARLRRFAGLWSQRPAGEQWLDAGCGAGTYTRLLRDGGVDVIGVDYSPLTILKARARSPGGIDYVVADVRALPFAASAFDGTLCFGVMQALGRAEPALCELARLTAPGGQLWVDALNRWCVVHAWEVVRRKFAGRPIHLRYESPATIRRILAAEGMDNVRLHWMPIVPSRFPRLQRLVESDAVHWLLRHVPPLGLLFCHAFIVHCTRRPERVA